LKKQYRFHIDLRGKSPIPARELTSLNPELIREQRLQSRIEGLKPAELEIADQADPLSASEQLEAYNASLNRAQTRPLGSYQENGIVSVVSFEPDESKWILSLPGQQSTSRISQLVLRQSGDLDRFSLEHREGEPIDLTNFLRTGLVDLTDQELAHLPGYLYLHLAYRLDQNRLTCVVQTSRMNRDGLLLFEEQTIVG
jgi:hypothetical protein